MKFIFNTFICLYCLLITETNSLRAEDYCGQSSENFMLKIISNAKACSKTGFIVGAGLGLGVGIGLRNLKLIQGTTVDLGEQNNQSVQIRVLEVTEQTIDWYVCTALGGGIGAFLGAIEGVVEIVLEELKISIILLLYE